MGTILDTIVEHKKSEVRALRDRRSAFEGRTDPQRPFVDALTVPGLAIVAEVKKASPSKGVIREDFDAVKIAATYSEGGAAAISVLTDERFFNGSAGYLTAVRGSVKQPVLRKDFIIDALQVEETASLNADAMLLIAAILSDAQMEELFAAALEFALDPLIEVHNGPELDRAMRLEPSVIGINNRDLTTFQTSTRVTLDLIGAIPAGTPVVSESGIFTGIDTAPLIEAGVAAVLVGESLMRADDPVALMRQLRHE